MYDVVVVGAGPAGSSAARMLAAAGVRVLIVEQAREVGANVQCAEYVPKVILQYADLRPEDVAQPVEGLQTYIDGKLVSTLNAPGYILNRCRWDRNLAEQAGEAGARIMTGTRAVAFAGDTVFLRSGDREFGVEGRVILGCDGPKSVVGEWLGNAPQPLCIGFQYEMPLTQPLHYTQVYFDPEFYGGYAWVFPKNGTANVGLGVHITLKQAGIRLLDDFCSRLIEKRLIKDKILDKTAGLIPFGGLRDKIAGDRMLLAGDAAGCTHPLTGAGIMSAVVSGRLAADSIIDFLKTGRSETTSIGYRQALADALGAHLSKAYQKAVERNSHWHDDAGAFTDLIRRSWIAFPEYHRG